MPPDHGLLGMRNSAAASSAEHLPRTHTLPSLEGPSPSPRREDAAGTADGHHHSAQEASAPLAAVALFCSDPDPVKLRLDEHSTETDIGYMVYWVYPIPCTIYPILYILHLYLYPIRYTSTPADSTSVSACTWHDMSDLGPCAKPPLRRNQCIVSIHHTAHYVPACPLPMPTHSTELSSDFWHARESSRGRRPM